MNGSDPVKSYRRLPLFAAVRLQVPPGHWWQALGGLLLGVGLCLLMDAFFAGLDGKSKTSATSLYLAVRVMRGHYLRPIFLHCCLNSAPQLQLVLVPRGSEQRPRHYDYPLQITNGDWVDFYLPQRQLQPWPVGRFWLALAFPDRDCGQLLDADLKNVRLDPALRARLKAEIERLLVAERARLGTGD